jgi:glycosyltransferase involved in cell wall biosynthesis
MSRRVKLGLVVPARGLGGAEFWARDLLSHLSDDFEVVLMTPVGRALARHLDPQGRARAVEVPMWEPGPAADSALGARAVARERPLLRGAQSLARRVSLAWNCRTVGAAINDVELDLIHVNNGGYPGASAALAAVLVASARNLPAVMTVHSEPRAYSRARAVERRVDARVARAVHSIATPSEVAKRGLAARGFLRVDVVPNGIAVPSSVAERGETRSRLGVGQSAPLVAMVARFSPPKDQATLLEAMARVRRDVPDATAILAGDGPTRAALRAHARDLGMEAAVVFPGVEDAFAVFRAADVAALVSTHEGVPLTIIEAMSQARPTVATDVGGIREVVEDGVSGFLTPVGDSAAVADRLLALLRDRELAGAMGAAAHQRFLAHHQLSAMVTRYEQLFGDALAHQ